MAITKKAKIAKERIEKLKLGIIGTVDEICHQENDDITFTEINSALIQTMQYFNDIELKAMTNLKCNLKK